MEIEQATDCTIHDMPENFEIREFLRGLRAEVEGLCIMEYNEADAMQMIREEGREEGRREGREEGRREGNITALYDLYRDGDITLQRAAIKAGMSEAAFLKAAKEITGI
jgi:predicted transposase YdaD